MEPTEAPRQDHTRYIDVLEDEHDYWLSITDAARVCRVQDVSIRRAITAGRLPVRRARAGENKRTRFVRASDLPRAQFPILDSGAAITSDIRKVDILNIPLQQQQLAEQQQRITAQYEAQLQEVVQLQEGAQVTSALLAQLQQGQTEQAGQIANLQESLRVQIEHFQQDRLISQNQIEQIQRDIQVSRQKQEVLEQEQQTQAKNYEKHQETLSIMEEAFKSNIQMLRNVMQAEIQTIEQREDIQRAHLEALGLQLQHAQAQAADHLLQAEKLMQEQLKKQIDKIQETIEKQVKDLLAAIHDVRQTEVHDIAQLTEHQDMLNAEVDEALTRAEAALTTIEEEQQRMEGIEQRLRTMHQQLQAEQDARAALGERFAQYKDEVQEAKKPGSKRKPGSSV